jgi:hypothetical protein
LSKKNTIRRGSKVRKLKTLFGDVSIKISRCHCKRCAKDFVIDHDLLRKLAAEIIPFGNVTQALKRVATLCGASWPYQQAETVLFELTGVQLSHNQIKNLCHAESQEVLDWSCSPCESDKSDSEAKVRVEPIANRPKPDCQYIGVDGVFINQRAKKKRIEAKVGILFTNATATVSSNRNLLLDKHYIGTFQNVKTGEPVHSN